MFVILLSGGCGTRLWPLTSQMMPKQFLQILPSQEAGHPEPISMFQHVLNQLQLTHFINHTIISASKPHKELIASQAPSIPDIILEPSCRDTYAAVILACSYLFIKKKVPLDETIIILPIDTYTSSDFYQKLAQADLLLNQSKADILLAGIKPSYASSKYGYILPECNVNPDSHCFKVKQFIEKPEQAAAEILIHKGGLWNSGISAFKLGFIIKKLADSNIPVSYDYLFDHYDTLPKISFDYEVLEKCSNIYAFSFDGPWKDLGTWDEILSEIPDALKGEYRISSDSKNIDIINFSNTPIYILGVSDLIVAASSTGILITDKKSSCRIKEIIL